MHRVDRLLKKLMDKQNTDKPYLWLSALGEIGSSGKWRVYYMYLISNGIPATDMDHNDDYNSKEEAMSAINEAEHNNPRNHKGIQHEAAVLEFSDISIWECCS